MNIADEIRKLQELHQTGALTAEEFSAAKATVLAQSAAGADIAKEPVLHEHLEEITRQNEIARLDREWEIERENYMIQGQHGHRTIPTRGASLVGGVIITGFGLFWTVGAASLTGGNGGIFACFPVFGIVFILVGVGVCFHSYSKANQYEEAYQAYQRRRAQVLDDHSERKDSP